MSSRKMSFTTVGGSSIITIFAVLCFIVFALLSLSTAKADSQLEKKAVDATTKYYVADMKAEEILAKLRSGNYPLEGVIRAKNIYSYSCPIDEEQRLSVRVYIDGEKYKILQWKKEYIGSWKADDTMEVWGGMEIDE